MSTLFLCCLELLYCPGVEVLREDDRRVDLFVVDEGGRSPRAGKRVASRTLLSRLSLLGLGCRSLNGSTIRKSG